MVFIIVKDIVDEVFQDYKKPSMLIAMPTCDWKCLRELNLPIDICQNCAISKQPNIDISNTEIIEMYRKNKTTRAIIFGGLEPMDSFEDIINFIDEFRKDKELRPEFNHIVIYTGYYKQEILDKINRLSSYRNVIIKFGRYNPNLPEKFDEVLGVTLASENQFAEKLKPMCVVCGEISENCRPVEGILHCSKHRTQLRRHKKLIKRTIYDPNEFIISGNVCEIKLFDVNSNYIDSTFIDAKHIEKAKLHKWYYKKPKGNRSPYCMTSGLRTKNITLQDFIMDNLDDNLSPIKKYDHIDNNGLNNLEDNLRVVTIGQNAMNKRMSNRNKSGVTGVFKKENKKDYGWFAHIGIDGKQIYLGGNDSFDKVVELRLVAEAKYFGSYSANYNQSTNAIDLTYLSKDDNLKTFMSVDLEGNLKECHKDEKRGLPNEDN